MADSHLAAVPPVPQQCDCVSHGCTDAAHPMELARKALCEAVMAESDPVDEPLRIAHALPERGER